MLKKIVVTGPESTGKSTLCSQLAAHYNSVWCPEYAREYLTMHGTSYSYDDLLVIARGQVNLEERIESLLTGRSTNRPEPFFIDTDMYVMKVWCEFVFGKCHPFILDQIAVRKYDLYLLCNTDLAWIPDELREYPDLATRDKLYSIYKTTLANQHTPWTEISGSSEERIKKAIDSVDRLLAN